MLYRITKYLHKFLKPLGYALLSNGFLIRVRRLSLYELDNVHYDDPGIFTYEYVNQRTGRVMKRHYDISQWTKPPVAPKTPKEECDPESYEAALWHAYETYMAALAHKEEQVESMREHAHNIARYILNNCISSRANRWVKTTADYAAIYELAILPEVTEEDIRHVLADTFPGLIPTEADFGRLAVFADRGEQDSGNTPVGASSPASVGA